MGRMVAPDKRVAETQINGQTYRPDKSGIYNVESSSHRAAMKREGFFEASLTPVSDGDNKRGFTCVECGFGGWFRKCGRCGHESTQIAKDGD